LLNQIQSRERGSELPTRFRDPIMVLDRSVPQSVVARRARIVSESEVVDFGSIAHHIGA